MQQAARHGLWRMLRASCAMQTSCHFIDYSELPDTNVPTASRCVSKLVYANQDKCGKMVWHVQMHTNALMSIVTTIIPIYVRDRHGAGTSGGGAGQFYCDLTAYGGSSAYMPSCSTCDIFINHTQFKAFYAFKRTQVSTLRRGRTRREFNAIHSIVGCMDATTRCFDLPDNQGQHCGTFRIRWLRSQARARTGFDRLINFIITSVVLASSQAILTVLWIRQTLMCMTVALRIT